MADLGSIGHGDFDPPGLPNTSWWATLHAAVLCERKDIDSNVSYGRISGIAQVAGVAAPGHAVMLLDRVSRRIVRTTYAGAGGAFIFDGLGDGAEQYMVILMDEGDPGSYNSKTADRITAVEV